MNPDVIKAVAVTAELCGREFSDAAARQFVRDLEAFPVEQVLHALDRCRRELQRPLTLGAVLERIDDGRPGPEEAWAMLPHDEATTVVWTTEMAEAWGIARAAGDQIASRMAFKETYARIVNQARAVRASPRWQASLGDDPDGREPVLLRAVELGRITQSQAAGLLPYHKPTDEAKRLLIAGARMLADQRPAEGRAPIPDNVRAFLKRQA